MMAALLTGIPSRQLQLTDLGSPRPGPGEALVAVRACGICGTDLHIMAGESYRPELPFVLGHEFMGTVLEGPGATQDWAGARVVPTLFSGCGLCEACRDGEERLCSSGPTIVGVLGRPGGFAAQVVVPYRHLLRVPEAMPDEVAAALVDAGTTACNAARLAMQARSYGDPRYLVLGGGPVGLLVSEVLRAKGQRTVVVEPNQARRGELLARGFTAGPLCHSLQTSSRVLSTAWEPPTSSPPRSNYCSHEAAISASATVPCRTSTWLTWPITSSK